MTDPKHMVNVEYFSYLSGLACAVGYTCEIRSRFYVAKLEFNRK